MRFCKFYLNLLGILFLTSVISPAVAQDHQASEEQTHHEATDEHHDDHSHTASCADHHDDHHDGPFDVGETAIHHISDQNVYNIAPWNFPLPCILYTKGQGLDVFMSSKFDFKTMGHGNGHKAYKGYVLEGGVVKRIKDASFPKESVDIDGFIHTTKEVAGEEKEISSVCYEGHAYELESKSTLDFGVFGGGITSFYDFSLTKNVVIMLLAFGLLGWLFIGIARAYQRREGMAPKGVQSFFEPMILFIRDEVAIPFLGDKYLKYFPFLISLFFGILLLNFIGQFPFIGNPNVTGNLAFTAVLAILAFLVTNLNGKKDYWQHIFWMPGTPLALKPILAAVEVLGLFIKPVTLMLRLFANITAGHIVLLTFVGLIFIFGQSGQSIPGSIMGIILSIPLSLFMMAIELIVVFIQAFVFTILTASYIGAAIEEHHH